MKKVQKKLRRSLAAGLAFVMTVSSLSVVSKTQDAKAADVS